ncbi:hypothetical protein K2173_019087 [Erythroxylum novogranatense]|uniref:RBR-type E3 ubiquitin transferase n=1 Tax=Erythroxylum novogranatense TaxID=1862640 RepID=A0AAV8STK5_9ROSI|nr:hypothetical protein K2173_019087 [Erythroxylum novogranatense]
MGNIFLKPQTSRRQQEKVSNFSCEICYESVPSNKKFKNGGRCMHSFCIDCIGILIKVNIEGSPGSEFTVTIRCPGLNCKHLLDPLSCRPIISTSLFNSWCDRLLHSWVLDQKSCYCPHSDCSALVLNECKKKVKKVRCPSCKREFCFECKCIWHDGFGCDESMVFRSRDIIDTRVLQLVEQNKWTRCPRCGHCIERLEGCKAVKCACGFLLCHECGRRLHWGSCNKRSNACLNMLFA